MHAPLRMHRTTRGDNRPFGGCRPRLWRPEVKVVMMAARHSFIFKRGILNPDATKAQISGSASLRQIEDRRVWRG